MFSGIRLQRRFWAACRSLPGALHARCFFGAVDLGPCVYLLASYTTHRPPPFCVYIMTVEIALASLHPPRPYDTRAHMHTGPLIIVTKPSLWLNPSLCYSLTHTHRSIGYRNQTQPLAESATRLMHLRVSDSRDSSRKLTPSPSLCYSLTHAHRSIGYRNQTQPLAESAARLMYLRGLYNSTSQVAYDFFGGIDV